MSGNGWLVFYGAPTVVRIVALAVILAFAPAFAPVGAAAAPRTGDLLGIRLGMTREEVAQRLSTRGELEMSKGGPAGAKLFWRLRDDNHYQWVAVRIGKDMRVAWITAFARQDEGRRPVRYSDIGDLNQARSSGSYSYTWVVQGDEERGPYSVTARGDGPDMLSSVSIHPPPKTR